MPLEMFRTILDEVGDILISVILYSWGEPFLNRELPDMIAECTARNILTITSTNGNCELTIENALRIVDAGLSVLVIALDGSNQEIYQRYRRGGDVEKVKHFASLIQEAKTRRGSEYPYTNLRAVVTRENEEDLPNIEKIAHTLGMNMFSVKSLGDFTVNAPFNTFEPLRTNMRRYGNKAKHVGANHYLSVPILSVSRQFFGTEPWLGVNLTTLWKILGARLENSALRKYGIACKPETCVRAFEKGKTALSSAKSVHIRIAIKMAVSSPAWQCKDEKLLFEPYRYGQTCLCRSANVHQNIGDGHFKVRGGILTTVFRNVTYYKRYNETCVLADKVYG